MQPNLKIGTARMQTITIAELQSDLWQYLQRVEAGETFTIVDADRAVAALRPIARHRPLLRPSGSCGGRLIGPNRFDPPLPVEILD